MQSQVYLILHCMTSLSYCDIQNSKWIVRTFFKNKHILTKPVSLFILSPWVPSLKKKQNRGLAAVIIFLKI